MNYSYQISPPIRPEKLSGAELDQLCEAVFPIHDQIFSGVDKVTFRRYVLEPPTELTRIFLCRNEAGEVIGYFTFQVYRTEIDKEGKVRSPYVFRTEVGLLPAYRGRSSINRILFWEVCRFMLGKFRPWRGFPEAYYMATPINPIAYYLVTRDIARIYPRPNQSIPDHIGQIARQLTRSLGLDHAGGVNSLVHKVGWMVRFRPGHPARFSKSTNPAIRYYLQENPRYQEGYGLMWLAPATLKNGVSSLWKQMSRKSYKH